MLFAISAYGSIALSYRSNTYDFVFFCSVVGACVFSTVLAATVKRQLADVWHTRKRKDKKKRKSSK